MRSGWVWLPLVLGLVGCGNNTAIPWEEDQSPAPSQSASPTPTSDPSVTYMTPVTLDGSDIRGNFTDFVVLISVTDNRFLDVDNGGHVAHQDGDDIAFWSGGELLEWEIERHGSSSGELVAWVLMPQLTQDTDAVIEITYGDFSIQTQQNDPRQVWGPEFVGVWHLDDNVSDESVSMNEHEDATFNNNDGTQFGNNDVDAKIAEGQEFDGDDFIEIPDDDALDLLYTETFAVSLWLRKDQMGDAALVAKDETDVTGWALGTLGNDPTFAVLEDLDTYAASVPNEINQSEWHHVVAIWDAGQPIEILVDGNTKTEIPSGDPSEVNAGFANDINLVFGSLAGGTSIFGGLLDEIRIEKSARSPQWWETTYINQNNPGGFATLGDENEIPIE